MCALELNSFEGANDLFSLRLESRFVFVSVVAVTAGTPP
jgi:hypothetical protein